MMLAERNLIQGETLRRDVMILSPRALVSLISSEPSSLNFALRELKDHSSEAWYVELEKAEEKGISLETALSNLVNGASIVQTIFNLF